MRPRFASRNQKALSGPSASGFSGRVYVVEAGDRYVVMDPGYRYSTADIRTLVVFDRQWRELSQF
jgi:hypothetical protein